MSTICWTIVHQAAAATAHGMGHATHTLKHVAGHVAHRYAHHAASVASPAHTWVEVVCKVVPAAVASGGVLLPVPANPPPPLSAIQPPAIVQAPPVVSPWLVPPSLPEQQYEVIPYAPGAEAVTGIPEPGSILLLLGGGAGLLLVRHRAAASQARARRSCCGADQSSEPSVE